MTTKVVLRADKTKAPGWAGFMAWLSQEHPDVYNYATAVMPQNLRLYAFNHLKTGGAQLTGTNAAAARQAQQNRSTTGSQANMNPASNLSGLYKRSFRDHRGLGDVPGYSNYVNAPGISMSFDTGTVSTPQYVSVADTGESTGTPALTSAGTAQLISALTQAGQAVLTGVNQQTIFNTQMSRAQQGLPPLNTSAYGLSSGGMTTALSDPTTLLMIGGGVLALVLVMGKGSKKADV